MGLVNVCSFLFVFVALYGYVNIVQRAKTPVMGAKQTKLMNPINVIILLLVGLIVRCVLAKIEPGYEVDMNCFTAWSDMVYNDGFANFYTSDAFTDYPPGYMYILWVVGMLRHIFPSLAASHLVVKMPAILCDLGTGFVIYKIARKRFSETVSVFFSCVYLFNPVILMDSAMWGQVDAVFTLCLVVMIYLLAEHKLIPAYFVFALGILIKPQMLILTPVLGFAILDQVIFKDFSWKRFFQELGAGLAAIGMMFLAVVPYGIPVVWKQYADTLSSYPYVTVNAYNFWAIFKLNWHSQDEIAFGLPYSTWGSICIVVICLSTLVLCWINRKKENGSKYFFYGVCIAAGFFTLSVRVHERYMFPVFAMVLLAYLYEPMKEYIFLFLGLTIVQANNIWHAFKFYDPNNFDWNAPFPVYIGYGHVLLFIYIVYIAVRYYVLQAKVPEQAVLIATGTGDDAITGEYWAPRASEKDKKFTKYDWISILAITGIYAIIALYNLGDKDAPQTYWETPNVGDCITLDLSNRTGNITQLAYYDGRYEGREFYLEESADMVNWTPVITDGQDAATLGAEASKFSMCSVFCWGKTSFTAVQPYLRLRCNSTPTVLNELVFLDESGNVVQPNNAKDYANLFDESAKMPKEFSFHQSTYFDEIYHGRTGYEMVQKVYNYEWTHPPLGKYIISIGIRIFGMCPYGWRIMGTLFGIAMLPIFYLFTRRFFNRTWIATITTILFAADFMHFAQTRIATIDVYVTFFIILMYYLMYEYYRRSFYDQKLLKTFIPLGLCGIAMGLGCACKWPGVYAGLGLGAVFLLIMGRRYMEYRYALHRPNETSNDIKHSDVIAGFWKKFIATIGFCCVAFIVVPLTIYTVSYIPFEDGVRYGLVVYTSDETTYFTDEAQTIQETSYTVPFEDGTTTTVTSSTDGVIIKHIEDVNSELGKKQIKKNTGALNHLVGQMVRNQFAMWNYHSKLDAEHPFSSTWYEWPIMKRPIWYYTGTLSNGKQENISAFGNPAVWWAGIPAFVFMLYLIIKNRDKYAIFLSVGYMAELLPWTGVTRCTFIYHYFPSVPFITIMIGYTMYWIYQHQEKHNRNKVIIACAIYAALAVGLFIMFYPVISGYPMKAEVAVKYLRWFKSWVLVSA